LEKFERFSDCKEVGKWYFEIVDGSSLEFVGLVEEFEDVFSVLFGVQVLDLVECFEGQTGIPEFLRFADLSEFTGFTEFREIAEFKGFAERLREFADCEGIGEFGTFEEVEESVMEIVVEDVVGERELSLLSFILFFVSCSLCFVEALLLELLVLLISFLA
jgi:hypothetical protein